MNTTLLDPRTGGLRADLPTAVLHDHLDGGLRPATIIELADAIGHPLPSADENELARWFVRGAEQGDLAAYLDTFRHTTAVMQTAEGLRRVAREAVLDLAADGVVYAEVRYAPEKHQERGLSLDEIMQAVQDGLAEGMSEARTPGGFPIVVNTIVCALRTERRSLEIAELTARWRRRDPRIVGFDLAGAETGWPAALHAAALALIRAELVRLTVHASEEPDLLLISDALEHGAERIGHGVRLAHDMTDLSGPSPRLGRLASYVRDRRICLEMAPTCHVQIGAVDSLERHPIGPMLRLGFNVTVNTDNRLMSGVKVSTEMAAVAQAHQLTAPELHRLVRNAVESGFGDHDERQHIMTTIVDPAWR
ncbi:adenosine deaminase [Nonomuraea sp. NPDC050790]|uniref:adenosine deaminase n=1 Tax=Nonomuraea sp. NPDC050790 TaxID=3364371 RepID=UPI0037A294E4